MAEYEKSIPFKNWSEEDFEGRFGMAIVSPETTPLENHSAELVLDKPYLFKAGGTYSVPQSQALHFARQLAIRELHRKGTDRAAMLSDIEVNDYISKCFPIKPTESSKTNEFERIDEVKDVEATAAIPIAENKTDADVQNEKENEEDDTAEDAKNNAGAPVFKRPVGRPRKELVA
jgi:hypothetical protein